MRRFQAGANGQILFVRHNGQSVTHQAVGHTPISIFSDPTVEKQKKVTSVSFLDLLNTVKSYITWHTYNLR